MRFAEVLHEAILDNLIAKHFLAEAVVANPQDVDRYVNTFIQRTKPDEGKLWLKKKLRGYIFNTTDFLTPLSPTLKSAEIPDFARQAQARGEPVFLFASAEKTAHLTQEMNHIVDWFNALAEVAARPASNAVEQEDQVIAKKELAALPRVPMNQITAQADNWFRHMGTRIADKAAGVHGGDLIMRWPNGYYALRYTDPQVMRQDGNDLQNCLRQGYYWDAVRSGTNAVIGIRKPNDEAVVGIRLNTRGGENSLAECKGKNNKPVMAQYQPYVIDLLTKLHVDAEGNHDLEAAGITVHQGKYGSFQDIADLVYDQNGIKIWSAGNKFVARVGDQTAEGRFGGHDEISSINSDDTNAMRVALNALNRPPSVGLYNLLVQQGIYFDLKTRRYGSAKDVGTLIGQVDHYAIYAVQGRVFAMDGDEPFIGFTVENKKLNGFLFEFDEDDYDKSDVALLMTATKMKPTTQMEGRMDEFGVYFDGTKYGTLLDVGKMDLADSFDNNMSAFRLGKRPVWILGSPQWRPQDNHRVVMRGKNLIWKDGPPQEFAPVFQALTEKYRFDKVEGGELYGVFNTEGGAIGSFDRFVASLPDVLAPMRGAEMLLLPWSLPSDLRTYLRAIGQEAATISAKQIRALIAAVRPTGQGDPTAGDGRIFFEKLETWQVYDLTTTLWNIYLPLAAVKLCGILHIEPPVQVMSDLRVAALDGVQFIKAHPNDRFSYGNMTRNLFDLPAIAQFDAAVEENNKRVGAEVDARRRDPNKYATDLSSRFAALNAFRKLNK